MRNPLTPRKPAPSTEPKEGIPIELGEDDRPIDLKFWFRMSRTWINGAEARLLTQATAIQSAVSWFFTLGVAGTVSGLFFKDKSVTKINLTGIGIALFCLFIAYACATLSATMPSRTIEEPNRPDSIRRAFNKAVLNARIYLGIASFGLVLGMGLIIPALWQVYNNQETKPEPIKLYSSYTLDITKKDTLVADIHISASIKDSTAMTMKIYYGKSFSSADPIDQFKHYTVNKQFDIIYKPNKELKKAPAMNLYLGVTYVEKTDSLITKFVLIKPN